MEDELQEVFMLRDELKHTFSTEQFENLIPRMKKAKARVPAAIASEVVDIHSAMIAHNFVNRNPNKNILVLI